MRLAVDTLGAPGSQGGMHMYSREMIRAWIERYDSDELLIMGYEWVREFEGPRVAVRVFREGFLSRASGQWLATGVAAKRWQADALLSVNHIVSPVFSRERRYCVVHDWRHLVRPEEFGTFQRAYRRGWKWSASRARVAFQISAKSEAETRAFAPRATTQVVPNGRDHPARWSAHAKEDPGLVLTFGHFENKRADLVVSALPEVLKAAPAVRLVILGARGDEAAKLRALGKKLGVLHRLEFPGYVSEDAYEELMTSAAAVVLASSDEGFGLPVCEANYFGIPCVVTADSGLEQIHPGRVLVAQPSPPGVARAISTALQLGRGRVWRDPSESWAANVDQLREAIQAGIR